jgi:4-diphosphocytidyl-2-C-methyl-D-erythritol kinase
MTLSKARLSQACPAKLNLFLEIQGKRPDGYHALGTLFQALEFGDLLQAESAESIEVVCASPIPGRKEENLVYKAAALLRSRYPDQVGTRGIRYFLEKRIPMGGGLGGGSSDASTALQLANSIWELGLETQQLQTLAAELGSDVPFFLFSKTAFAEGRGEQLTSAPAPYPFHIVLATPHCHVATAWAYGQIQKFAGGKWNAFQAEYVRHAADPDFYGALHNDFQAPISAHFPEIREILAILTSCNPVKAMMTGSGAGLFALFVDARAAELCLEKVAPRCRFSTLTRFLASPRIC